jgi:hypothetical protein
MSDLFDPLRDMTREPASSLPATEVRRRGDQQRRRRTAVQVLGGAAAVAVVAFGAFTVADRSPSSTREVPPASDGPSPTATQDPTPAGPATRVPDGFPLEAGMLDLDKVVGPSRSVSWFTDSFICGEMASYSPADVQTDSVGVNHDAVESGGTQRRVLMVYPDANTAHRMARDLVDKFEACPRYPTDTGDSALGEATTQVTPRSGVGDEAWTIKTGNLYDGQPNIGQTVYVVVRVGNAVMYQMLTTEGPGLTRPGFFEKTAQAEVGASLSTVSAMCVFTEAGCGDGTDTARASAFGPDGYGDVRLYLTAEEVDDTGQATVSGGTPTGPSCTQLTYAGSSKDQVDGYVSSFGVVVLFAPSGVKTPEGLAVGSPEADVRRLYPDAEKQVAGWRIPLDGGRQYFATVDETGSVAELSLESADQTCIR